VSTNQEKIDEKLGILLSQMPLVEDTACGAVRVLSGLSRPSFSETGKGASV